MKKCLFLIVCLSILLTGCSQSDIVGIPNGYIDKYEYYQKDGFQDYTDYAKYIYSSKDDVIKDKKYKKILSKDVDDIKGYFDDFSLSMESSNRMDEYDFDDSIISEGDYVRVETKEVEKVGDYEYGKYENYSVYFFDVDSLTLYYIHNNV